ncbi:D-glycerate dehydrogenase [Planctomycetota bacterium]|nr:D-glycerate dehydrogenase [Planctomycetota bacterium]
MSRLIYVTRSIPKSAIGLLIEGIQDADIRVNTEDRNLSHAEIAERAKGAAGIICTLADPIDAALMDAIGGQLKVISNYAVGYNNIDTAAATERGIAVTNTPDVLTEATAEIAVGLILDTARRISEGDRLTRAGNFEGWAPLFHRGQGVYAKTVGIVGAGRIGHRVAATMRHGFGCEIVYHSRSRHANWDAELGAKLLPLNELLEVSDIVSLHCPLTDHTHHLIDAKALTHMKPSAILVNTARGAVIDEAALVAALTVGRLAGAGLDVFENEPALAQGLAELENVVAAPHIGSATIECREQMGRMCAHSVIEVLAGREPSHRVV